MIVIKPLIYLMKYLFQFAVNSVLEFMNISCILSGGVLFAVVVHIGYWLKLSSMHRFRIMIHDRLYVEFSGS